MATVDSNRARRTTNSSDTPTLTLEERVKTLLDVECFEPPAGFAEQALGHASLRDEAAADPLGYWARRARELHWDVPFTEILDESDAPAYRWFADGQLNASYNCLDRHVEAGLGDRVAFHWCGEEGEERDITYTELLADVQRLANVLKSRGVGRGDVVGIYLPMIPEVVVAMLACARIGAPHNVVFGGFAPEAVSERMEVSAAKALITVDGARRKGRTAPVKADIDVAIADLDDLQTVIVVRHTGVDCPMTPGRDIAYAEALAAAAPHCPAEPLDAEHPLFILYSSGSTAKPKGIVHTTGGYLAAVQSTHRLVFDLRPESDVYFCTADVGWITGHSYIVYGPLLNGCTSVMYEGAPDYPHKGIWWELCDRYRATIFYTAPTAIRACMSWGEEYPSAHDLSSLRVLGTVGEPINPKAWLWYREIIGAGSAPIVDTWFQTETGAIMITTLPGSPMKPGSAGRPLPGVSAGLRDRDGQKLEQGTGNLVLERPWPSMLRTLYGDYERYVKTYWNRYGPQTYLVGDAARIDADGYTWVIGRIDDVINVSGHRLSTGEIEAAIDAHDGVAEAAVVGQADELTGQSITAFVRLKGDQPGDDVIAAEIRAHVAKQIGKLARPKRIIWAPELPKTRSGKIMRRLLRDVADGRELGDVTTLLEPTVMAALAQKVREQDEE